MAPLTAVDHDDPWEVVTVGDYLAMPDKVKQSFTDWLDDMGVVLNHVAQVGIGADWVAVDTLVRHPCGVFVVSAGVPHVTRRVIVNTPPLPRRLRQYLVWTQQTDQRLGGQDE
jgi:hypothetical protein